jgi:hypothetical protein
MARIVMHPQAYAKMDVICSRVADQVGDEVHHDALAGAPTDFVTVPPQKRGALRASIHGVPGGKSHYVVVGTDWWMYPEYGTGPHVIRSHGTWQLRNRWVGKKFGWVVQHPGSPEQAYMRRALYQKRRLNYVGMV